MTSSTSLRLLSLPFAEVDLIYFLFGGIWRVFTGAKVFYYHEQRV